MAANHPPMGAAPTAGYASTVLTALVDYVTIEWIRVGITFPQEIPYGISQDNYYI